MEVNSVQGVPVNMSHKQRGLGLVSRVLLGVIGVGVAGNAAWLYKSEIDKQGQVEEISALDKNLMESRITIQELSRKLKDEKSLNEFQAGQMAKLSTELAGNTATVRSLREEITQGKKEAQDLTNKIRELSSRITLDQIVGVVKKAAPSTVRVEGQMANPFTGEPSPTSASGVVIKIKDGRRYILTCGHVTDGSEERKNENNDPTYHIKIYNGNDFENPIEFDAAPVILSNGKRAFASPNEDDLALLEIPPNVKLGENVGVTLRDFLKVPLSTGEPVIAIGNPFGQRDSVTFGVVSHPKRKLSVDGGEKNFVQVDAQLNPGNSGGGVFDIQGNLVGMCKMGVGEGTGVAMLIGTDRIEKVFKEWGIPLR